jgi:hypothetical protein
MAEERKPLERVTVNLVPRASKALQLAVDITGDSKTDTINRAIQMYAYFEHTVREGGTILVRDQDGGELSVVRWY